MNKLLSILLVACMLLAMLPGVAFATPGVIYLHPNENWLSDGARFAAYFFGSGEAWVSMSDADGDGLYEAAVPQGMTHVIFCRLNPDSTVDHWDNTWNQTRDLEIPSSGSNRFMMDEGDWYGNGYWAGATTDYYLFGYINGADYAVGEDWENLGQYKFTNGQLVAIFEEDSYVGVKAFDNARWYMTDGWQGEATSVTLYNSDFLDTPDKLFVPGGRTITFTLAENDDGTLTLSYETLDCDHSYAQQVTTAATCTTSGIMTYTCTSCGHSYTQNIPATGHKYSDGSCVACGAADPSTSAAAVLVTNASSLKAGDEIIIVALEEDAALSTVQNTSNRGKASVTKSGTTVVYSTATQVITLETGAVSGTFGFDVGGKYLYAASSYGNYLKSATTLSANASWSIGIDSATGAATIVANGSSSRNILRYSTSGTFACFADATASEDVAIYKVQGSIGCTHNYLSQVTAEPTCTDTGLKQHTCDACGDSYTETLPALGHKMLGGKCTRCGTVDPNYTVGYCLFGWINGAAYACEDDFENVGIYKFSGGILTATFETDSYLGVKTDDNAKWYMTDGWQDDATSVTLYETGKLTNPDKLMVPGGVRLTFTLVENDDGSLTLNYFASSGECPHPSHDRSGSCISCGEVVWHRWQEGFCAGCGSQCAHQYSDRILTAPTCDANGEMERSCSLCGNVTKETVMATGHSYQGGWCSLCGQEDPGAVTTQDYYLFGWIDGADYACQDDWENLGKYKFVGGRLTTAFGMDSYIGVKSADNVQWFMTDGWQGDATSVTLYDTGKLTNPDKLMVPGGVQLTFTVRENSDGTLTLSYTVGDGCLHLNHGTDGYCKACGEYVGHSYQGGTCACGLECDHSYVYESVTQPSCDVNGEELYRCSKCGVTQVQILPATGHSYQDGWCVLCGAQQPEARDYYLFGYINGADYGCNDDWENLGQYRFVNETLTVTFEADSYIGVKTGDNASWYMTDGWQGTVTTAVLYNTSTLLNADKLFVPGGVELTLTLKETVNDTLTISYTMASESCQHLHHSEEGICTSCGQQVDHDYYNGRCTICGTREPGAATAGDYYLFGYINGVDYGCNDDWENLGLYGFVNGKLSATFETDSYIGIKTSDNLTWYMTADFETGTSTTFYNTTTGVYEKLLVPGGVQLNFTLVEGQDDTLFLSYTIGELACTHDMHNARGECTQCGEMVGHSYREGNCTVCGKAQPVDYYLFGMINNEDHGTGDAPGDYKFVDGKLTVTFETDSLIGVKTGDSATWYMTADFETGTSATFYPTSAGVYEKMYVPGGVELTFTLTENADGTLTLSYTTPLPPTITLKYPTLFFKDEVKLNVYYDAVDLKLVTEMGLIIFDTQVDSYTVHNAKDVVPGYQYNSAFGLYSVTTRGIPAKNMGDTIWFAVYTQLNDGTYTYSKLVSYSPRDYAYTMLGTGDSKLDSLLVALLNYGTAAQLYFGYNTDNLLNSGLTDAQKGLVTGYSSSMMVDISSVETSKQGAFLGNGGFAEKSPSVTFGGAFAINYYCLPSYVPQDEITLYYWTEADYNSAQVLSGENATGEVTMTPAGGRYRASVSGISAKDLGDGVYVAFVYNDGTTTYSSGVLAYSIGMYCKTMAGYENTFAPLAEATAVYGYYAKQYFG